MRAIISERQDQVWIHKIVYLHTHWYMMTTIRDIGCHRIKIGSLNSRVFKKRVWWLGHRPAAVALIQRSYIRETMHSALNP